MSGAQLNNVSVYVAAEEFDEMRRFYGKVLGHEVLFEQSDIVCFRAGDDRALCVHLEGELGRAAGDVEIIFWVEDLGSLKDGLGAEVRTRQLRGGALEVTDPSGRAIRFQERPST